MSNYDKRQKPILPEDEGTDVYDEFSQNEYLGYEAQPLEDDYNADEEGGYYQEGEEGEYYETEDGEYESEDEYESEEESVGEYDDYSDESQFEEEEYHNAPAVSSVDERLEQIYRRLEEMDKIQSNSTHEVTHITQPSIPFYVPQTPPYYMSMPPQSGGGSNEIILNELAKLREDNYRAQHKSELREQIEKMREDFENKLAVKKAREHNEHEGNPLLNELKKISARIEKLEQEKLAGPEQAASARAENAYASRVNGNGVLKGANTLINNPFNAYTQTAQDLAKAKSPESGKYPDKSLNRGLAANALRIDEILAAVKAVKLALGADNSITYDELGNPTYNEAGGRLSELRTLITQSGVSLTDKIKGVIRFNELMGEIPAGVRQDLDYEFDKIRGIIFGLPVTKDIARELFDGFALFDRGVNIEDYFELKDSLTEGDKRDMPAAALKLLERKNRLQGNRYINYNDQLYNDLLSANNDYISADGSRRESAALRLKKAVDIFGALRVGDLVAISDYKSVRPVAGFKSISEKIDEILDFIRNGGAGSYDLPELRGTSDEDGAIADEIANLKETTVLLGEERHNMVLNALTSIKAEIAELKEQGVRLNEPALVSAVPIAPQRREPSPITVEEDDHEVALAAKPAAVQANVDLSEIVKEFGEIKEMLSFKCDPDYDTLAQIASLKEEMRISRTEQEEVLLDNINALRDEIRALGEFSEEEYAAEDTPEDTSDPVVDELIELKEQVDKIILKLSEPTPESALLYEVRALKEEVFVAKGEIDPEILKEIRNLKEMLSAAKDDDPLSNITVELSRLKEEVASSGDVGIVAQRLEDFRTKLDKLKPMGIAEAAEISINVVKDSIVEILNEITALRDELNARNAESEGFYADVVSIKEDMDKAAAPTVDFGELYERLDGLKNVSANGGAELGEIIEKLDFLTDSLGSMPPATAAIDGELLRHEITEGLSGIKQDIAEYVAAGGASAIAQLPVFAEIGAHTKQLKELSNQVTLLKEQIIMAKSQSDASVLVESTALREQVIALKNTVSAKDIGGLAEQLKEEIASFRQAATDIIRTELNEDRIRAIIREEIAAFKPVDNGKDAQLNAILGDFIQLFDKQYQTKGKEIAEMVRGELNRFASEFKPTAVYHESDGESGTDAVKIANSISTLKEELAELVKIVEDDETVYTSEKANTNLYGKKHTQLIEQLRSGGVPESSIKEIISRLDS